MYLIPVVVVLTLAATCSQANLLDNPGFEDGPAGWEIPSGIVEVDRSVVHSGDASLKLSWDDPAKRKLATHPIPCKPGKRYLIGAWLKSKDVFGALKGIHFGVEWFGKKGYIGGAYPMGIGWETDWQEIVFLSDPVPADANYAHVFATIDYNGRGTGWIDDISVTEVDAIDVLDWTIDRATSVGGKDSPSFKVTINKAALDIFDSEAQVSMSLCSPPWNSVLVEKMLSPAGPETVEFDSSELNEGVYKLVAVIKDPVSKREMINPQIRTVYKRPPMQVLTEPHSAVIVQGNRGPTIRITPFRAGKLSGTVLCGGQAVSCLGSRELRPGKEAAIPVSGKLDPGRYEVQLKLKSDGFADYDTSLQFTVISREDAAKATLIGHDNWLIDRGKPLLPMFVYAHTAFDFANNSELEHRDPKLERELLDRVSGTPFGILDYATPIGGMEDTIRFADECARRGIRFGLSVKDIYEGWMHFPVRQRGWEGASPEQIVRTLAKRLKNHPALAFYYTNDELSTQYFGKMAALRRWLHEEDPLHPTLHVHYDLECIRELAPSYDIFGPELYPWMSDELTLMAEWSDTVMKHLPKTAPFWGCLWHFKNEANGSDKLRALSYLAIAKGARGLLFYAFYELKSDPNFEKRWSDLVALGREIESRAPILMQPELKGGCATSAPGIVLRTGSGKKGTWLMAVNATKKQTRADITVPHHVREAKSGDRRIRVHNGRFTVQFKPFGVEFLELL